MRPWLSVLCLVPFTAAAGLSFESTPTQLATVNQLYRYDVDGTPSVSTDAGVGYTFAVTEGPADLAVDNLTGEIFWFPAVTGLVPVELTVTNALGEVARQRFVVTVTTGSAPTFAPPSGLVVPLGRPLTLQLRATTGDAPLAWQLLGNPGGALLQPESGSLSWVPMALGPSTFTVSLTNVYGSVTHAFPVEVVDTQLPVPTASLVLQPAGDVVPGSLVQLDASGSTSGTSASGARSFLFDFGDGSPSRYGAEATTQQGYGAPGVYTARVVVENVHLQQAEATTRVVVRTDGGLAPPSARIVADRRGERAPIEVSFACDCAQGDSPLVSYTWEFGDGETSDQPSPTHVYARPGGYNVKLRVGDTVGLEARDSFYLPVWSSEDGLKPPFARARVRPTAIGDAPFSPQLVAEFGDPDGIVVSRTWRLPDGRTLVDEDPTLNLQALGSVRVELSVRDNDDLVSTDVIELRATRDGQLPPVIRSKAASTAKVGAPFVYDEDGRASAVNGPFRWAVGLVVDQQRVGAPAGMTIDEATGALTWTPTSAQLGSQEVALVVTNAAGSAVQRFSVQVAAAPGGCGCDATPWLWSVGAVLVFARRRR